MNERFSIVFLALNNCYEWRARDKGGKGEKYWLSRKWPSPALKIENVFVATRHATIPPSFGTAQKQTNSTLLHHTDVATGSIMQITSSFLYSKMFDCPISSQLLPKVRHLFNKFLLF
jgi:hypothetical protein